LICATEYVKHGHFQRDLDITVRGGCPGSAA
jgi:hypothetical protein